MNITVGMIFFIIKKTFFDMWDNLYKIIAVNLILMLTLGLYILLRMLFVSFPAVLMAVNILFFVIFSLMIAASHAAAFDIADYKQMTFGDIFSFFKRTWRIGIVFFVFIVLLGLLVSFMMPFYSSIGAVGSAKYIYTGSEGSYKIRISYLDRDFYKAKYYLFVDGKQLNFWESGKSKGSDAMQAFESNTVSLKTNSQIIIKGVLSAKELAYIDFIEFVSAVDGGIIRIEAENMILDNYSKEHFAGASGDSLISVMVSRKTLLGRLFFQIIVVIVIAVILSLQFFFPLYLRLNKGFIGTIKLSFTFFFDNLMFSMITLIVILIILLLSMLTAYLVPGLFTVFLWINTGVKIRLYKYKYLEENKDAKRNSIPWDILIQNDSDIIGKRSLKNLIFPWKE